MENDQTNLPCTACDGTGTTGVNLQDLNEEEIEYHPLECQPCKGTGLEPEQSALQE